MITLRPLDAKRDRAFIAEAVGWLDSQPQYFRSGDAAWGTESVNAYLRQMKTEAQIDLGVFESGGLVAVITLSYVAPNVFNSHLMVRKGTNPEIVEMAAFSVLCDMFRQGMIEGWAWLALKNYGARRIIESIGMKRDGLTRYKGQSHGRPIKWLRYVARREFYIEDIRRTAASVD